MYVATVIDIEWIKLFCLEYHKIPKISDTRKIAVITLKFEQNGFTIQ